ncbi:MAG: rod shape-determining protein MreD [Rickettsiales bacterium]|nr:rod shape-determining protein MreD [Rickettsiales bacterium]
MLEQKSISRIVILHLVAILLVILNVSDIRIAGLADLIPLFDLMAVFYFVVFKSVFGVWFIFLLGIWNDALNGNPLGVTALCYIILTKFFLLLNHKLMIRENFKQIWQQFIAFCFCFLLMKWLILSIFNGDFYSLNTVLVQFILSSVLYVIMHKFFDYLSVKLLQN